MTLLLLPFTSYKNENFGLFSLAITIVLLFIYMKEIIFGYNPKSKKQKNISLFIILFLIGYNLLSFPLFSVFLDDFGTTSWLMNLSFTNILRSFIGLIINRIISKPSLKHR